MITAASRRKSQVKTVRVIMVQYYTGPAERIVSRTTAKKNNLPCKPKLYRRRNLRTNPHFGLKFHALWTSNLKLQISNF